jgi:type II secretory pathway pseudopilin PulG
VVLIILGILASVAVSRFNNLEDNSKQTAINSAISDLNGRESLTWANQIISTTGYGDDQDVLDVFDYNLGSHYAWTVPPDKFGGTLEFKGLSVTINRTPSTAAQPAVWSR